jgi:hypothetical protein
MATAPQRGWVEPCVAAPSGFPTNHHYTPEGLLGQRVTPETATCMIVCAIPRPGVVWAEIVEWPL